jgi:hypothetical protein
VTTDFLAVARMMLNDLGLNQWRLLVHDHPDPVVARTNFEARTISMHRGHACRHIDHTVDTILHEAAHIRASDPTHGEAWRRQVEMLVTRYARQAGGGTKTEDTDGGEDS